MAATGLELCRGHSSAKPVRSAFPRPCPTSTDQSIPGLRPSHGKGLVRGYFGHGCYWFGALQEPLHCNSSSAIPRPCPTSKEQSNPGLGPSHGFGRGWLLLVWSSGQGHFTAKPVLPFLDLARQVRNKVTPAWGQVMRKRLFGLLWMWMAATGLELCQGHFIAEAVLPFLDLARQVRNKVTPDWGQVTGKSLVGVTLVVDGCYWFGALQAPLHCRSSSAFPRPCPTSKEQSNPGLGPSNGKELGRGYFGRGWLLLVWSSASANSLQKQFCLSRQVRNKVPRIGAK